MSNEIVIVYAYLDSLAHKAKSVASMLEASSTTMNVTFPNNPNVTNAYHDFVDRWDKHRDRLHDSVASAGAAFAAVSESFKKTEAELVAALNGSGGSNSSPGMSPQ